MKEMKILKKTLRLNADPSKQYYPASGMEMYAETQNNATSLPDNLDWVTTQIPDIDYDKAVWDDGNYISHSASASTDFRYALVGHKFVCDVSDIMKLPNIISKVIIRWDGYVEDGTGKLMLKTPTGWTTLISTLPTSDGSGWEVELTRSVVVRTFVDKKLIFGILCYNMAYGGTFYAKLHTDAVQVEVEYRVSDLLNSPIINPTLVR